VSPSYELGTQLEVEVVKIIPNGLGLCFAEQLTVFVPLSAPGDLLRVELADIRGKTAFAKIVEVLRPGKDRVTPACRYFGDCGGCDFQQLSYPAQLDAKIEILRDSFRRIAGIKGELHIKTVPCPEEFGYRIRTQVHADPLTKKIGFYRRQSHDVIEAGSCPILDQDLDRALAGLRAGFDWDAAPANTVDIVSAYSGGRASIFSAEIPMTSEEIVFRALGREYLFTAESFFQANRYMIEHLIRVATEGMSGGLAVDLYCGIGLFTLPLADEFERVFGVENSPVSLGLANRNAEAHGATNIEFVESRVRHFLSEHEERLAGTDLVIVDPPRSGLKPAAVELLSKISPARINYVSCNPSTLARDTKLLIDSGYEIESVTALDLFPQTHHVEAVVRLVRGN